MLNNRIFNHRNIYIFGLVMLASSLPVSLFMMSVSQFILVINWILEGNFKHKLQLLKERKSILLFVSIYFVHIIGLIYTSYPEGFFGQSYNALKDLRIKLPLLLLPVVIGTSEGLSLKQLKILLQFFFASIIVSSLISTAILLGLTHHKVNDIRNISSFISHIRFALLIDIAIFSAGYILFSKKYFPTIAEKVLYPVIIIWLAFFLFLLQSMTGITILVIMVLVITGYWAFMLKNKLLRILLMAMAVTVILLISDYIRLSVVRYYTKDIIDLSKIEKNTRLGNPYVNDIMSGETENGHYLGLYQCEKELREEWNKISSRKYDSFDQKGQGLKYTLMRYLTSKGLRKDASGVAQLSKNDIELIEKGYANCIYTQRCSLYPRIYEIIWELDRYFNGGNPSGHSISQRIEYLKAGIQIIKDNIWFGIGTGDAQNAFNRQYNKMNSSLSKDSRLRAHNQFVTLLITFGITGFLWIMFAMFYPIFMEHKSKDYLFIIFFIIACISMLDEDTWETQAGITFFVYFYVLFLFGRAPIEQLNI
ncbi:MAG: O-antigen ligase family protein [Bacteroidia bacterium]|nr:O-antigen ligase family protein [Bacteroidia bacterium]